MFLRNKKTGEVIEWDKNLTYKLDREYTSLKELCENYEDCEAPEPETWSPKWGDEYYRITEHGVVVKEGWGNNCLDDGATEIGNVFRTKEEAEKAHAWLRARKVLFDDTKGYKPNWGDCSESKYYVFYARPQNDLRVCCGSYDTTNPGPYFATKEDAEASVKAHEKEWKIYLGVDDE